MINKKNVLGKPPQELGVKDAIHVAIVSVRAAHTLDPGERVGINEHGEAFSKKEGYRDPDPVILGVVDPFAKGKIFRGENCWMLLDQKQISNVQHSWDHPTTKFNPPARIVELNKSLVLCAEELGVPYQELMQAAQKFYNDEKQTVPSVAISEETLEEFEWYDFWSDWAAETCSEFENYGSECCPEYDYPGSPFSPYVEKIVEPEPDLDFDGFCCPEDGY